MEAAAITVPLSQVSLSALERGYAHDAVDSGWISGTGSYVRDFEAAVGARVERRHVVAVANGTVAVELALHALGIGAGDEVIVPAFTFVAPAAAVRAVGATPVFADITAESWTLDPAQAAELVTPRTRAIVGVDLLGHPCDAEALSALGVPLIEDAAQAHGAGFRGRPAGSLGLVSTFSFHANKTISTGEGGCVATDDPAIAERARLIANHGMTAARPYWHTVVGHNFRMTNVTAAIGVGQAARWDELVAARRRAAAAYDRLLDGAGVLRRPVAAWATEACWIYSVAHPERARLVAALRAEGIDARPLWPALPELPPYRDSPAGSYPVACEVAETAFWLPTWAGMEEETLARVAGTLRAALHAGPVPAVVHA
jgi:perosamine synthetase